MLKWNMAFENYFPILKLYYNCNNKLDRKIKVKYLLKYFSPSHT